MEMDNQWLLGNEKLLWNAKAHCTRCKLRVKIYTNSHMNLGFVYQWLICVLVNDLVVGFPVVIHSS